MSDLPAISSELNAILWNSIDYENMDNLLNVCNNLFVRYGETFDIAKHPQVDIHFNF